MLSDGELFSKRVQDAFTVTTKLQFKQYAKKNDNCNNIVPAFIVKSEMHVVLISDRFKGATCVDVI